MCSWLRSLWLTFKKRRLERTINRLVKRNRELEAAIEAATGEPFKFTPEEKSLLRAKAKGIPRERFKQISSLDIFDDED